MSETVSYSPTFRDWLSGARPHTWANAFAPVIAGTGAAALIDEAHLGKALLALIVSWALIVGVNYANDYSDGIRGTDEDRTGPQRLTGGGLAKPEHVKRAAFIAFGVAGVAGIALSLWSAWWLILVGILCVAAAWFYTGGKNPYGYRGLGEVAVFIFFGLVAVMGTQFTQAGEVTAVGAQCAVSIGAISAAVNLANNIRDIPTDRESGKITMAVRLGDTYARYIYTALVAIPFASSLLFALGWWQLGLAALIGILVIPAVRTVLSGAKGTALIPVLGQTGRAMLVWSVVTAVIMGLL